MSTPAQITAKVAKNRRRALILGVVLVLMAAVGLGIYLGRSTSGTSPESVPEASPSESEDPQEDGAFMPESGERVISGRYPAEFSHSPEGAASAVVHGVMSWGTNDVQALATSSSVYYGVEFSVEDIESELLPMRAMGIERSVPAGHTFDPDLFPAAGSYHYITPTGIAWDQDEQDQDLVSVWVLAQEEISDGLGTVFERPYVHGRLMRWDPQVRGGDWVVEEITDPIFEEYFDVDPAEFELDHERWTPLEFPEPEPGA